MSAAGEVSSPSRWLLALLVLGFSGLAVALLAPTSDQEALPATAPPLPGPPEMPCEGVDESALRLARESEYVAQARVARYPYAPPDGLVALARFAHAEQCYRSARDDASARRVAAQARIFRMRISRDYRDYVTRYERALAAGEPERARPEIDLLLELLAGHEGPFTAALRHHQLTLAASAEEQDESAAP